MEKTNLIREFDEFGQKMYILAILSIISIFTQGIIQFAMFIIMLLALRDIKQANQEYQNENLDKFRKYIIYAVVIGIVGTLVVVISVAVVGVLFIQTTPVFNITDPFTVADFQQIAPWINFGLIVVAAGLPVAGVSLVFLVMAWSNLNMFFMKNSGLFPTEIASDAIDGSMKVKKAYIYILIILILGELLILISIFIFPQIEQLVISFLNSTIPSIELLAIVILPLAIIGIAIVIFVIMSFIQEIRGYFRLGKLRYL